jgi:cytochrome c oxidase subunit 3
MAASTDVARTTPEPQAAGHAQRGMDTAMVGMLLFIASEAMFFAGLFGAYFNVKATHLVWPPEGFELDLPLAAVMTLILITSSFTMQWAMVRIRRGDRTGMNRALVVTIILGVVFLAGQLWDYAHLGFGISSGVYGSLFFTMTGFHFAHVVGGVIGLSLVLARGASGQFSARHHTAVAAVGMYWDFVDLVWIGLFTVLYLVK